MQYYEPACLENQNGPAWYFPFICFLDLVSSVQIILLFVTDSSYH